MKKFIQFFGIFLNQVQSFTTITDDQILLMMRYIISVFGKLVNYFVFDKIPIVNDHF